MSNSVQPHRRQPTRLPSLGFSRQEHWSGLPFPSPMHESEKWKVKVKSLSHARLLATPWTAAHQAPPSMGFSRQKYWSGVPLPSPKMKVYKKYNFSYSKHKYFNSSKVSLWILSCTWIIYIVIIIMYINFDFCFN